MSATAQLLRAALVEATGERVRRVWYAPLTRGAEMQGPSGGWMYELEDGTTDCLGTDATMAVRHIVLLGKQYEGVALAPPRD